MGHMTHKHLANGYVVVPRTSRKCTRYVVKFVAGMLLGLLFTSLLKMVTKVQSPRFIMCTNPSAFVARPNPSPLVANRTNSTTTGTEKRGLLLVGVMTADKYVSTRARAVYETWGKKVPGKILFFTAAGNEGFDDLPIVPLPGVDDSYPPQKKSFLMLKYMHDNYRDKYEWFMRADDDVFVRMDKLEAFLRDVNSSNALFIGQAGKGIQEEFGLLSLEYDENFCMGGPGVIMSHVTLSRVAPQVKECLHNLYTTHEDVELGRCVQKFAGVPCTWSYEMQNIFYHNSSGRAAFTGALKTREVHRAITLHPVKQFSHMYRLHNYLQSVAVQDLVYESLKIRRQRTGSVKELRERLGESWDLENEIFPSLNLPPGLNKFLLGASDEVLHWDFLSRAAYSVGSANPRRRFESSLKEGIDDVVREVMESINTLSKERGRIMDFKDILYGYYRLNPRYGIDYILDMLLVYKKYRGRKMTVPVRRHAYLQQPFGPVQIRQTVGTSEAEIHFVLPIAGRLEIFERFMKNYIDVCVRQDQNTRLVVVLFQTFTEDDPKEHIKDLIESYRNMFQAQFRVDLVEQEGPFARAVALEQGSERCKSDDCLLFFVDVDMAFTLETLHCIRTHTIQSHQTYFPIVFSQYDTNFQTGPGRKDLLYDIVDSRGYWRFYGFGIASIYRSDLRRAGGFNTTIRGWGQEDVDLFDRILTQTNLTVFRAPDVGLVHVFHAVHCASDLEAKQKEMCLGTKANTIASQHQLARYFIENNKLHN